MNINPISFGQKIPIEKCRVLDKTKGEYVDATLYEFDCEDRSDIREISDVEDKFQFGFAISMSMEDLFIKKLCNKRNKNYSCINENNSCVGSNGKKSSYYALQTKDDKIIGLCTTDSDKDSLNIRTIESRKDSGYKYVGLDMLAILAKTALALDKKKMTIGSSLPEACSFYEDVCGFKQGAQSDVDYEMNQEELEEFVERNKSRLI